MENLDLLIRHIRTEGSARCRYQRATVEMGDGSVACQGCGQTLTAYVPPRPSRVDVAIDELSMLDVDWEAAQIFGAFGARHVEPAPVLPADFQGHPDYE